MGKVKSKDFTWFGIFPSLPWAGSSWRAGLGLYSPEFSSTSLAQTRDLRTPVALSERAKRHRAFLPSWPDRKRQTRAPERPSGVPC